ncbi:hypothetical protein DFA_01881 [Cavenderia fasciculata]|uniref:HEAT repeat-containing protein n=1 Tax=Cavenderia fasciculata TaxID=261658 RepID=F4PV86_CACFS|nr:uncharacterized protein DFA_01881 [Cavenderia fasciculata]EGG21994.1 hypothetical protein DFA_01881 [Cavenderia fasciculata]|eukprot:XP_004359845.1 hypothetical protein DFA_01881 [Cavenderia fasciculata]
MEQPPDDFIQLVITLAREDEQKKKDVIDYNNNNTIHNDIEKDYSSNLKSTAKQQFNQYALKHDRVVSWLLYLIVNVPFPTIKEKSVQLLDRLTKKGETKKLRDLERIVDLKHEDLDKRLDALKIFNSLVQSRGLTHQQFRSFLPLALSVISQLDGIAHGGDIQESAISLMDLFANDDPSWMQGFIRQIIDTFLEVMDRHRGGGGEKGNISSLPKNIKRSMFDFLLLIAESNPVNYVGNQIDKIFVHMYDWLIQVKDVSMKEWNESNTKIDSDNNYFNFHFDEEKDDNIVPTTTKDDRQPDIYDDENDEVAGLTADSAFERFAEAIGLRVAVPILTHFNNLLKSQHWKERYAAMISLSKVCQSVPITVSHQFNFILTSALNFVDDENTRVRWASFQLLIQLSIDFDELMVSSRDQLFNVIGKSINDKNERVQSCCCVLVQTMMTCLTKGDTIDDNILDGLFRSFEILLASPKIYVVESAFASFILVLGIVKEKFIPVLIICIASSNLLTELCNKLRDKREDQVVKAVILFLMAQYCTHGGESAINSFPLIIPTIVECLTLPNPLARQNASFALGLAAQTSKDRFSTWVMPVLQALNVMISLPTAHSSTRNKIATENAISSIGRIIRYVTQVGNNQVGVIISKWLSKLPIDDEEEILPVIDNLCAIVHLYTDECLGPQYQHVVKIHEIIQHYIKTTHQQDLLLQTWSFIKESIKSNWDNIPSSDTKFQIASILI